MITVVSMNPSIDLTYNIPTLARGQSHRVSVVRQDIAGKAVNNVLALSNLGLPCRLVGFDFIQNGDLLKKPLDEAKIPHDLTKTNGAIRTNIKIFEEETGIMTEINQEGQHVPEKDIRALVDKIANYTTNTSEITNEITNEVTCEMLILSGSLPQGVPTDIYAQIIKSINTSKTPGKTPTGKTPPSKTPIIVDTSGPALLSAISALKKGPHFIKPNLQELESTCGQKLPTRDSQISTCRFLLHKYNGLKAICLSLGEQGALMIGREEAFFAPAMDIKVRGVQGAGDSMVAGIAAALYESPTTPLDALLLYAMAAAAASLILEGTQMVTKEGFTKMMSQVQVRPL